MNNRQRMYNTNSIVRKWLKKNGYKDVFFFLHTRFSKDWNLEGQGFDGICVYDSKIILFQVKTNMRATKKILNDYSRLNDKFGIECLWINKTRLGIEINNSLSEIKW